MAPPRGTWSRKTCYKHWRPLALFSLFLPQTVHHLRLLCSQAAHLRLFYQSVWTPNNFRSLGSQFSFKLCTRGERKLSYVLSIEIISESFSSKHLFRVTRFETNRKARNDNKLFKKYLKMFCFLSRLQIFFSGSLFSCFVFYFFVRLSLFSTAVFLSPFSSFLFLFLQSFWLDLCSERTNLVFAFFSSGHCSQHKCVSGFKTGWQCLKRASPPSPIDLASFSQ